MSAVKGFYDTTVKLIRLLEDKNDPDRDVKIKSVQMLLDQREGLMKDMSPPFSPEELTLGKQIVALNQKVDTLLNLEKMLIQQDMKTTKQKKQNSKKYYNPYESLSALDGAFYDKRK